MERQRKVLAVFTALLLVVSVAVCFAGEGWEEEHGKDKAHRGKKEAGMYLLKGNQKMADEKARHEKAAEAISKEKKALLEEIKAAIEKAGEEADVAAIKAGYSDKMKAVGEKYVAEMIKHAEKKLAIIKAEKKAMAAAFAEKMLTKDKRGHKDGKKKDKGTCDKSKKKKDDGD